MSALTSAKMMENEVNNNTTSPITTMEAASPAAEVTSYSSIAIEADAFIYIWMSREQYAITIQILTSIICFIAFCGVVLNAMNIKTFIQMGLKDGVTVMFMCLAISDFCATLASVIMSTSRLFQILEDKYNYWFDIDPSAVHLFSLNVAVVCNALTSLTTSFIAIARCVCVAIPFKFKNTFTRKKCALSFICFIFITFSLWIPVFANMGVVSSYDPTRNSSRLVLWLSSDRAKMKDIVGLIIHIPMAICAEAITVVCVLIMVVKLRESVRFRQGDNETSEPNKNKNSGVKLSGKEKSIVIQVVTISVIFIICNTPKMSHAIFTYLDERFELGNSGHYLYLALADVFVISDCINNCANFFVYAIFNSRFKDMCLECSLT